MSINNHSHKKSIETYNKIYGSHIFDSASEAEKPKHKKIFAQKIGQNSDIFNLRPENLKKKLPRVNSLQEKSLKNFNFSDIFNTREIKGEIYGHKIRRNKGKKICQRSSKQKDNDIFFNRCNSQSEIRGENYVLNKNDGPDNNKGALPNKSMYNTIANYSSQNNKNRSNYTSKTSLNTSGTVINKSQNCIRKQSLKYLPGTIKQKLERIKNEYKSLDKYDPENYAVSKTAFARKMVDLYHEENIKPNKDYKYNKGIKSSRGYFLREMLKKKHKDLNLKQQFNSGSNQRRESDIDKGGNSAKLEPNQSQAPDKGITGAVEDFKKKKNDMYTNVTKFNPKGTCKENYNNAFNSSVVSGLESEEEEKNVTVKRGKNCLTIFDNRKRKKKSGRGKKWEFGGVGQDKRLNNVCKWASTFKWYDDTEMLFNHPKNIYKNAKDRKFEDQCDNNTIYYSKNHKEEVVKNRRPKVTLDNENKLKQYKRYMPKEGKYQIQTSKLNKMIHSSSDFHNDNFYPKSYAVKDIKPKEFVSTQYIIKNCPNLDTKIFQQKLSSSGIHFHDVREDNNDLLDMKNKNIRFKVRDYRENPETKGKLDQIESELKTKDKNIKITELLPIKVHRKMNREIYNPGFECNSQLEKHRSDEGKTLQVVSEGRKRHAFSQSYANINYRYKNIGYNGDK